jgi:ATP-dependent protease HslVU (ClpYQ) ATPase subunit
MPTQEERLTTVEYDLKQFKTETIKAYGETAIELVMVKGLTEDTIKRLASIKTQIDQQFEQVNTRLDRVETMLTQILARLPEKP